MDKMGPRSAEARSLAGRLSDFLSRSGTIPRVVRHLCTAARSSGWRALLFGGAIRDVYLNRAAAIRDIDLVIADPDIATLRQACTPHIVRSTRFGGLQLCIDGIHVDVWPLSNTWAFRTGRVGSPAITRLSATTFLNIEGVVADIEFTGARASVDVVDSDAFFDSVRSRMLEINLADNPFPDLCVVRSLVLALDTGFQLGPDLVTFIAQRAKRSRLADLLTIQQAHYGTVRIEESTLEAALEQVVAHASRRDPVHLMWPHAGNQRRASSGSRDRKPARTRRA